VSFVVPDSRARMRENVEQRMQRARSDRTAGLRRWMETLHRGIDALRDARCRKRA